MPATSADISILATGRPVRIPTPDGKIWLANYDRNFRTITLAVCSQTGPGSSLRPLLQRKDSAMDPAMKKEILSILDDASDMTIATVREDGYPQATTVSYVNNGLNIFFGCAANSQKAKNLARDSKVSLTVNILYTSWNDIRALSIGGRAERVTDPQEVAEAS